MIIAEDVQNLLRKKQKHWKREIPIGDIHPTPNNDSDRIGTITLEDLAHVDTMADVRELNFLDSAKMWVRTADGGKVESLEEALPGGRKDWRLIDYYVSADKAAVILNFIPVSEQLKTQAQYAAEILEKEYAEQSDDAYWDAEDAEEDSVCAILQQYQHPVQLRGWYKLFLANEDGSGEYVQRRHTQDRKTKLKYCEASADRKTLGYVMIRCTQTMTRIHYI